MSVAERRVEAALASHRDGGAVLPLVIAFDVWARETWQEQWLNGRLLRRSGPTVLLEDLVEMGPGDVKGNDDGAATRLWHGALRELAMRAPDKVAPADRWTHGRGLDGRSCESRPDREPRGRRRGRRLALVGAAACLPQPIRQPVALSRPRPVTASEPSTVAAYRAAGSGAG